ncbi:hypothetical protein BpHYR1_035208 [Brachionus plicatilis]|uniref:Uncharacterized protein n=1 Tax=Brachionus plicatilis TaxID=10195 RepID=A0A3M7T9F6_BRAPC|nr:hypothetical protein BpHYR1_035208 [Brachionus plicatilis]
MKFLYFFSQKCKNFVEQQSDESSVRECFFIMLNLISAEYLIFSNLTENSFEKNYITQSNEIIFSIDHKLLFVLLDLISRNKNIKD